LPLAIRALKLVGAIRTDDFMCNFYCVCGRALGFLPQQLLLCVIEPQDLNRAISDSYFLANISSA
jgi:hypothetical protein